TANHQAGGSNRIDSLARPHPILAEWLSARNGASGATGLSCGDVGCPAGPRAGISDDFAEPTSGARAALGGGQEIPGGPLPIPSPGGKGTTAAGKIRAGPANDHFFLRGVPGVRAFCPGSPGGHHSDCAIVTCLPLRAAHYGHSAASGCYFRQIPYSWA